MRHEKPKTILFLLNSLTIGGSEKKTVSLVNELSARGYKVHIGYLNAPHTLREEIHDTIPVFYLERQGKLSLKAIHRLLTYVRHNDISTIFNVNLHPLVYSTLVNYLLVGRTFTNIVSNNTTDFFRPTAKTYMLFYSYLMKTSDKIVFGCKYQQDLWIKQYQLDRSKCMYIYNGVDEERFSSNAFQHLRAHLRCTIGISENDFLIGSVAQLRPEKQHSDLIVALAQLAVDYSFVSAIIVGDGVEKARLKDLVKNHGLDSKVFFLGAMTDVRPALAAIDVFVLTSVAVETFSNAALEAMSMQKPVVLSDVGGSREMVIDGVNGYIYPKGDVNRLVARLKQVIESHAVRQQLGANARKTVEEKFTFHRMVDDYEVVLEGH